MVETERMSSCKKLSVRSYMGHGLTVPQEGDFIMGFIDHYYVIENLQEAPFKIRTYDKFENALADYFLLPADKMKAFGVQNTMKPFPGSLDFIQCKDWQDVFIHDYETQEGWDNPEVLAMVDDIKFVMNIFFD